MAARDFFIEVGAIFFRWLKKTFRRPAFVFFAMVQPVIWFLLFTQSFASIADIRQPTGVPGQFITFKDLTGTDSYLTFFSAAVIIQTIIIVVLGVILGVTFATGVGGVLIILLIAVSFGVAWSGISTFIALATRNSEATLMISLLTTFPLLFLSTAVMPKAFLPKFVQSVATYNPITYIADAIHVLIISGFDWTAVGYCFLVILGVGAISLSATTAMFRKAVAH